MNLMQISPEWPTWVEELWWREAWLSLEAIDAATLPPYLGSTLRGAMGHLLKVALCDGPGCGHQCRRPDSCRYYSLFERSHEGAKPYVLLAPPPPGLENIALGGPVTSPYRSGPPRNGESVATLRCEAKWQMDSGAPLTFGLRLFGSVSNLLPALIDAIASCGLTVGCARFALTSARDAIGNLLYDRRLPAVPVQIPAARTLKIEKEQASRLRIVFVSPAVFKLDRAPTFSPEHFAGRFFDHAIGRAGQMHWACTGSRPPWVDAPLLPVRLCAHRFFHYELPRHSFRQDKWLDFDGAIGFLDLEGDFGPLMPWARLAEVLHFGQKAAFGLGRVRVFVLG